MEFEADIDQKRQEYASMLEESLEDILKQLKSLDGVRRISVFGSFARGRRDLFTDLDILVVMETEMGLVDRLKYLYSKLAVPVDLDILCYTPQEVEVLEGKGWLKSALRDSQVLYEA